VAGTASDMDRGHHRRDLYGARPPSPAGNHDSACPTRREPARRPLALCPSARGRGGVRDGRARRTPGIDLAGINSEETVVPLQTNPAFLGSSQLSPLSLLNSLRLVEPYSPYGPYKLNRLY